MSEPTSYLHRAPYVVPMTSFTAPAIIEDGAVFTEHGRIVAVGRYTDLKDCDAHLLDHEGAILTPALVNCHAHLELSHLAEIGQGDGPQEGDITGWISELLAKRFALSENSADNEYMAFQALAQLYSSGCRAVADIGNLPESLALGDNFKIDILFFLELLGLGGAEEENSLARLAQLADNLQATAHAPYSTSARLITALKHRARRLGHLFPIHMAESLSEIELLATGGGSMRDFLTERGAWNDSFKVPGCGAITYLDSLNGLDDKTLCVHCVHIQDDEIALLRQRAAKVCLCPASNRFLGVGTAPAAKLLANGIIAGLGTDSLASNAQLSIWHEMQVLLSDHPGLDPAQVFYMATAGGAAVLGLESQMGSLQAGASASFLAVTAAIKKSSDVFAFLAANAEDAGKEYVEM